MRHWLLWGLAAVPPVVMAQTMITEPEVKTFLTQLEQSFNKKDIKTYGNTLASQFKVILHLSPTDKATYNRQDYLDLLGQGFKESPDRKTKYAITSIKNSAAQTIVEGKSTETDGKETVTGKWRLNLAKQGNKILITQMELFD
jgi:hypothetical protein